jgi:hypothetical protein
VRSIGYARCRTTPLAWPTVTAELRARAEGHGVDGVSVAQLAWFLSLRDHDEMNGVGHETHRPTSPCGSGPQTFGDKLEEAAAEPGSEPLESDETTAGGVVARDEGYERGPHADTPPGSGQKNSTTG